MALVEFYKPRRLSARRLDAYLAKGWFRSSNGLFRNQALCLSGQLCTIVNIRVRLAKHTPSRSHARLLRKTVGFRVEIGALQICAQMEELYQQTSERFKGFVFPDLHSFLYDFHNRQIFQSLHVKVYDGKKLVAASVFDTGEKAMMSVLGVYDRQYKHLSPGILTMLHEMEYGKREGYSFYYPGYVLHESSEFNYKLTLGNYEYLNSKHRWVPDYDEVVKDSPVNGIVTENDQLEEALRQAHIPHQRLMYKLFSLGYAYPKGTFLRNPIIFILPELSDNPFKISLAAYDPEDASFQLSHPLPVHDNYLSENQSLEFQDPSVYYDLVLQDCPEETESFGDAANLAHVIQQRLSQKAIRMPHSHIYLGKT